MEAGKDVFCEKPMTHTIDEAARVVEAVKRHDRVMTVAVQSTAHPQWREANKLVTAGKIGHVMQAQTGYYRNSDTGQWRYPISEDMTPKTVDWKMFLGTEFGLAPDMPFNRAKYGQWRCYWEFGGGIFTDLFTHQLTHLILAVGVRTPRRVVAGGGLYLEYDGRAIPDTGLLVADYDEGCQVFVTGTMGNTTTLDEVIRGHAGTIKFTADGFDLIPQKLTGRPGPPIRDEPRPEGTRHVATDPPKGNDADTRALWENFLDCVRSRNPETYCTPELGRAAVDHGQHGRAVIPRGEGPVLRQGNGPGGRVRSLVGVGLGGAEPPARQASPGDRLARRRLGLDAAPVRLPEARRRLGRRRRSLLGKAGLTRPPLADGLATWPPGHRV